MKLPNPKRILSDDFDPQYKGLLDRLSFILNAFMIGTTDVINGKLGFENFQFEKIVISMTFDGSGVPIGNNIIQTNKTKVTAVDCVAAVSINHPGNSTYFPTNAPFVNFQLGSNGLLQVLKVTGGLTASEPYNLTLIIYN